MKAFRCFIKLLGSKNSNSYKNIPFVLKCLLFAEVPLKKWKNIFIFHSYLRYITLLLSTDKSKQPLYMSIHHSQINFYLCSLKRYLFLAVFTTQSGIFINIKYSVNLLFCIYFSVL